MEPDISWLCSSRHRQRPCREQHVRSRGSACCKGAFPRRHHAGIICKRAVDVS